MKILYHHRIGSKDGQFVHIEELVGALRQMGHEVMIAGPAATENAAYGSESTWIHGLKRMMPKFAYELLELGYNLIDYLRLSRAIARFDPDVIYERYNLYCVSGIVAKRRYRRPLLLEVNAPLFDERERYGGLGIRWLARWSERFAWRGADRIVAVTQVLARRIEHEGIPHDRITVTPNGINARRFRGPATRAEAQSRLGLSGKLVLGFVGFMREWHRLDRVIDLLTEAAAKDVQFVAVGTGPALVDVKRKAHLARVTERVTLPGSVESDRVPEYVHAFDIALQPSVVPYASPLKLFEYMACGCAIVAPDTENIREVLTDGRDALLFDAEDPDAFARSVARLISSPDLREKLGAGASSTLILRNLTWDHNAEVVTGIAERLAGAEACMS